ncbi:MAG: lamin tail domain-containing protein [Bacteroidetes bacterium]|nr:lamin tail domain-containing protein [Bacteroidota bacterium]
MKTLQESLFLTAVFAVMFTQTIPAQVVISEIYGGGGNSGSTYKNDFIELYNSADSTVVLDGWSVQYASASATGAWKVTILGGSIAPHGFFLVQEDAGTGGTTDLPSPDAEGVINISAGNGKIALCNTTAALTGASPPVFNIIDLVGFGSSNFFEGSSPASAPSNTKSIERKASYESTVESMCTGGSEELLGNAFDSNDNGSDFIVREPQPQNSDSRTESLLSDVTPPVVDSVSILSNTQIGVFFNEAVDSLSSSFAGNFIMDKAAVILAQRSMENLNTVILTVPPLARDFYSLTIGGIKDIAGNEMPVQSGFSLAFGISTIAQARAAGTGSVLCVRGIVTAAGVFDTLTFIQDTTAGIAVSCPAFSASAHTGDIWELEGRVSCSNGLLCIDSLINTTCLSIAKPLPECKIINTLQAGEAYESQLVTIPDVSFAESGVFTGGISGKTYHISDDSARLDVRIPVNSELEGLAIPAGIINLQGILGRYYSRYQIIPRNKTDLVQMSGPAFSSPPAITSLTESSFTVSWTTSEPGYSYVLFGTTPQLNDSTSASTPSTSHNITVSGRQPGRLYYFRAVSVNDAGTSYSAPYCAVTTSPGSSGQIHAYFNYDVDGTLGLEPSANGNTGLLNKLLERISSASRSIDLALYSFDDFNSSVADAADIIADSLVAAKNRGAAVRIVFDNRQTSYALTKLIDAGIPVQKRNLQDNNGIMHNKFFIFDGRDTIDAADDWTVTGSWNLTDAGTYLDAQNAVFVQDQSLARIYTLEFEEMFGSSGDVAVQDNAKFGYEKQDNTPHFTFINGTKVEVYFGPSDQTNSRIIQAMEGANYDIFFSLFEFTRDDLRDKLIERSSAGAVVKGIIDQQTSELNTLQSAGIDVLEAGHSVVTGFLHHKYCIVDPFNDNSDPLIITGSHNWSTAADLDNDENTLIIHSGGIARQYVQEFSARYKESGGTGVIVGIERYAGEIPKKFELMQNYPNPFNATTAITFFVGTYGYTSLRVYDILGREIAVLVNEIRPAGIYTVKWDASNMASGVYFYRLSVVPTTQRDRVPTDSRNGQAGNFTATKKMLLMK